MVYLPRHPDAKLLIIDDDASNCRYLKLRLSQSGFDVHAVYSAAEALNEIKSFIPELFLLDIKMPGMDGFQLCAELKKMEGIKNIPVIFLTALRDTIDKLTGFDAGGVDYVTKPINYEELIARINTHLTLSKQTEQLRQNEAKFQMLAYFSYDFEYWISDEGKIVYVSPSAFRVTGYSANEFENNPGLLESIIHPEDSALFKENVINADNNHESLVTEFRIINKSGETIWLFHKSQPVINSEGKFYGRRVSNQDITSLKMIEMRLRDAARELRDVNVTKDQIFTILAHDIKSPFTGLLGMTELVSSYIDDFSRDELKEYVGGIHESAKVIFSLIENLLVWSRVQGGRFILKKEMLNADEIAAEVIRLFENNATEKNITLKSKIEPSTTVYADKTVLSIVLRNLISNSIKFTPKNGLVSLMAVQEEKLTRFTVKDTGIGMTSEVIQSLMKNNKINSTEGTNKEQGSGVGIAVSRDFIKMHNGTLLIESSAESGTEISFTIPFS